MSNIALTTAARIDVVESLEQLTLPTNEAITAGAPVRIDATTGKFTNAKATDSTEADVYGIATRTVKSGMPVTAIRRGVLAGFDFTNQDQNAKIYLSDTDGRIADAAGTVGRCLGSIIPGTATVVGDDYSKMLRVDVQSAATGTTLPSGDLVPAVIEVSVRPASLVDQAFFIANRAYQVTAVKEIHSTAGNDAGAVNLQVTKDTSTDAPGAGTDLLTNNTNAGFDLKGTANTVQSGTLTGTTASLQLAAGDRLSLDFAGTLTTLAGVLVTVSLKPI